MIRSSQHRLCQGRVRIFFAVLLGFVFLFALVLTADPERRLGFLRDATRRADVRTILDALESSRLAQNGAVPNGIDTAVETFQMLGTAPRGCAHACGAIPTEDRCLELSDPGFPPPKDPQSGTPEQTGYAINRTSSGRFEVVACQGERTREIRLRR